ncbi:PREDICTED: uncharacterized protein LOC109190295 [Ipomoea nil]|uniref:uncharacterized protein LOC109190295 n=1 Tax=Ipomoea nil TaxID=35883 RepID=UPI0009016DB4|nr:PREDICTED: uncharacterized protein LOC109190295 [Ipomoea nil]
MSTNSSERTITTSVPAPATTSNPLSSAHHFVSIKLTSRNFLFWRTQLVPFLRGQELLGFITGETPCPSPTIASVPAESSTSDVANSVRVPNPEFKTWVRQDTSILSLLVSSMADEVLHLAVSRNTSKEFQSLRQGNLSPADYIGQAQLIVEALSLAGRPLSLDEQNLWVFRGLRPEFRSMAYSLTVSGNPVTLPQLADFLQAQEFIAADDLSPGLTGGGSPAALYVAQGSNQSGGGAGGRRGNSGGGRGNRGSRGGQWRGGRGGRGDGGQVRCQICRAHGHSALNCNKRYNSQPAPQANLTVAGDDVASSTGSWFPDTKASAHATPDASMLSQSSEYNGGDVLRVGNGTCLHISHIGSASIPSMSKPLKLSNVLHDSITQAVLLKGPTSGGLYKLPLSQSHFAFLSSRATPVMWHRRLGHPHSQVLNKVLQACPVIRNKTESLGSCTACHMGKASRSVGFLTHNNTVITGTAHSCCPTFIRAQGSSPDTAPLAIEGPSRTAPAKTRKSKRQPAPVQAHVMRLRHMTRGTGEQFHALTTTTDPTCYSQAVGHPQWRDAMDQEFNALLHNGTWRLVPPKSDMNIIGCKWVFRTKHTADGSVERYKARLVAKGFNQVAGEDFFDTFSPVVKPTTVRLLLSLAVSNSWTLRQLDVHNAFLNGHLDETVYMKQPPGYEDSSHPDYVCHLQRSLYGLKQAPRAWFKRLHDFLISAGFLPSKNDVSLFHYTAGASRIFLLVYVDDIIMMGNDTSLLDMMLRRLSTAFKIRDLGTPGFFLGIGTLALDGGYLLS